MSSVSISLRCVCVVSLLCPLWPLRFQFYNHCALFTPQWSTVPLWSVCAMLYALTMLSPICSCTLGLVASLFLFLYTLQLLQVSGKNKCTSRVNVKIMAWCFPFGGKCRFLPDVTFSFIYLFRSFSLFVFWSDKFLPCSKTKLFGKNKETQTQNMSQYWHGTLESAKIYPITSLSQYPHP